MAADDFRVRLEGGAEVLEAASVRLRALNGILDSLMWRERLVENAELVEAIRADDAAVRASLRRAERLSEVAPSRELGKLISRVKEQLERAESLAAKRARASEPQGFAAALSLLLDDALPTPEGDGQRWRTARATLRGEQPMLQRVAQQLPQLHYLAHLPKPERVGLPWERDEVLWMLPALAEVDVSAASLWKRLPPDIERALLAHQDDVDTLPEDAPSLLLRAEWVRRRLHARIEDVLKRIFAPLTPSPHESTELLRWLVSRSALPKLQSPARSHLFALAASLTEGPPGNAAQWDALLEHGKGAGDEGADAAALLDNLKLFLRIQQQKKGAAKTTPSTLYESLLLLRALSS